MFSNWQYRVLALALALSCWYIVTGREKVETWAELPVEIVGAPQDLVLRQDVPTRIRARIRGSRALIRSLAEQPPVYTLNLSGLTPGDNALPIDKQDIPVSMALEVLEVDPARLMLTADPLGTAVLPVKPVWRGGPGEDFELAGTEAVPAEIRVHGPEPLLAELKEVPTLEREVRAQGAGEQVFEAGLALPKGVTSDTSKVTVHVNFAVKTKTVWIRLPLRVLPENVDGRSATLVPTSVQIQAEVPLSLLRQEDFKDSFPASVVAPGSLESGPHLLPVSIKMPVGSVLLKTVPEKVEVRIKKS